MSSENITHGVMLEVSVAMLFSISTAVSFPTYKDSKSSHDFLLKRAYLLTSGGQMKLDSSFLSLKAHKLL